MTDQEILALLPENFFYPDIHPMDSKLIEFARTILSRAIPEGNVVVPGWLPIEQCKREHGKRYLLQKDCGDGTLPSITIGYSLDGDEHWFYQDVHHSIEEYGYRVTHFQEMPGYAAAPANKEG
ncbi:hypothetical protein [Herbaspirillum sp. CAH-3]|uniref:hypothetical protein n=1 Tax=Herbaspirillum sp. CAH-3 TaxID=2605746 RepID=UPI0012ACF5A8|nr:hypothetical protein [Herbaspirillum sp. CAH-3]MRT30774.1 hypothetical protein [Herbaspirillum sp. CAH-3]